MTLLLLFNYGPSIIAGRSVPIILGQTQSTADLTINANEPIVLSGNNSAITLG